VSSPNGQKKRRGKKKTKAQVKSQKDRGERRFRVTGSSVSHGGEMGGKRGSKNGVPRKRLGRDPEVPARLHFSLRRLGRQRRRVTGGKTRGGGKDSRGRRSVNRNLLTKKTVVDPTREKGQGGTHKGEGRKRQPIEWDIETGVFLCPPCGQMKTSPYRTPHAVQPLFQRPSP